MKKNPNKKAGEWGALNNKPINQIYFKDGGRVKLTAGGEKHVIYKKTTKRGEGKVGDIMVNHPTTNKGKWDTIDLTKKAGAKTVKQGIAATKKWHKENPYPNMKKKLTKKAEGGAGPKQPKVIIRGNKVIEKNGSYKIITKTKDTYGDSPEKNTVSGVSKAKRTLYGVLHGAPKPKNAPSMDMKQVPTVEPEKTFYMKKGGSVKGKVPKGYHIMPNGKLMKDSAHNKLKKK